MKNAFKNITGVVLIILSAPTFAGSAIPPASTLAGIQTQVSLWETTILPPNPVFAPAPMPPIVPTPPTPPQPFIGAGMCDGCALAISINAPMLASCQSVAKGIAMQDRQANDMACDQNRIVGEFRAGSSVDQLMMQTTNNIETYGTAVSEHVYENATSVAAKINEVSLNLQDQIAKFQKRINKKKLERDKELMNKKMDFMAELKEKEIRAKKSEFSMNDTAEEIAFIEHQLEQADTEKTQELIYEMKNKYDANPDFVIPIQIKSSERYTQTESGEKCEPYDPSSENLQTGCFYYQKANPGKKLETIFQECSRAKKQRISSMHEKASAEVLKNDLKNQQTEVSSAVVSEGSLSEKQDEMRKTNCNYNHLSNDLCGQDLNAEQYIGKVIDNEIIPNGHLSATNLFMPPAMGSFDGETQVDGKKLKATTISASDKGEQAVSGNTPSLIHTYKTSSQYLAAQDFVDSIVNRSMISNQPVVRRQNMGSSEFQSRYLQRSAALSLSEKVLNSIIEKRVGTKILDAVDKGEISRDDVIREDINGAGYLDNLEDSIEQDYSKIVVGASSGQKTTEALSRMAPKNIKNWQYQAQILNTKMKLDNRENDEEIELLLSTYLSQNVNSPDKIEFLEQMRSE